MAKQFQSPYLCHVFVCTNDRKGERRACADGGNEAVRAALKKAVAERGWRPRVRVSQCGCMGLCEDGPNVILYPQRIWFSGVSPRDVEQVLAEIRRLVGQG